MSKYKTFVYKPLIFPISQNGAVDGEITALKATQSYVIIFFAITAAGFEPSGGPKKSLRTSYIVQIIFSFWSFEISEGILRNQN